MVLLYSDTDVSLNELLASCPYKPLVTNEGLLVNRMPLVSLTLDCSAALV